MILKANQIYKHFKGNLYRIIVVAKHAETGEDMVVYQALYGEYQVYTRPLREFLEELDRDRYPQAEQKYRFEPVPQLVESVSNEEDKVVISEEKNSRQTADGEKEKKKNLSLENEKQRELKEEKSSGIDPMLEAYLDTDSYRERLNILHALQHKITDHMLLTMAVVVDFELPEGSMEEKYDALHDCLLTREKYECNRMI